MVFSDAVDVLCGSAEDFSLDLGVEECRSMHWRTHDGYGLGWMVGLVKIVSCITGTAVVTRSESNKRKK